MKLYQSIGPNPHVVRMFIAEKGIDIRMETVDVLGGENRKENYLKINPRGQSPALVTDSGQLISEITAICEYLEELHPAPPPSRNDAGRTRRSSNVDKTHRPRDLRANGERFPLL